MCRMISLLRYFYVQHKYASRKCAHLVEFFGVLRPGEQFLVDGERESDVFLQHRRDVIVQHGNSGFGGVGHEGEMLFLPGDGIDFVVLEYERASRVSVDGVPGVCSYLH